MICFYLNSKAKTSYDVFEPIYQTNKSLGKASGWIIYSVRDHNINIPKNNHLTTTCYIKVPKELNKSQKGIINIQNIDDNESLKWCLFRYLLPAVQHPAKIVKVDRLFGYELDFEGLKFPVKIKDFAKLKKRILSTLVFLVVKIKQNTQSMYQKNVLIKKLLIYY